MKKQKADDPCKFQYTEKPGDIVIITWTYQGDCYEFYVHQNKENALSDLYSAWKCNYSIIYCSDEEILKLHKQEIAEALPRYVDFCTQEVVDKEGKFHATT